MTSKAADRSSGTSAATLIECCCNVMMDLQERGLRGLTIVLQLLSSQMALDLHQLLNVCLVEKYWNIRLIQ